MPRIRTLKPEHRMHRKTGALSHIAYRLWVGMILEADDEGRLVADAEQLRVLIFGYHGDVQRALVESSLQDLAKVRLVRLYEVEGVRYAWFPSWHDHQKIDRKTPSRLPAYEESSSTQRALVEGSSLIGSDRIGSGSEELLSGNGARRETSKPEDPEAHRDAEPAPARPDLKIVPGNTEAREILDYLNRRTGRAFEPVESNLRLIRARLAEPGRTRQQVLDVIDVKTAEWLNNPEMNGFLRPETLFGAKKFAQYVGALSQGKPEPKPETPEEAFKRRRLLLTGETD